MFDAINIGTSGLLSHAKGLRTVGNNLANVNTPGFKSSQLAFTDLFDTGSGAGERQAMPGTATAGMGLATLGTQVNFKAGLDAGTGNPLDLNINGNGFYAIERDGKILYTRAGGFQFDEKGILVSAAGEHVKGLDAAGKLVDINIGDLGRSTAKVTTKVSFRDNLTSVVASPVINAAVRSVPVFDAAGVNHPINLAFKDNGLGVFSVTVTDAAGATVTTGELKFKAGVAEAGANAIAFSYAPAGVPAFDVNLDFSAVTSQADRTTLAMSTQDGYAAGVKTDQNISSDGTVKLFYSNGQKADGPRLALANFRSPSEIEQVEGSAFRLKDGAEVEYGHASDPGFGTLQPGHLEGSNVDLAEEFGNLILMQRGYQASSHVISTANDMIQQLFDMKGR